MSRAILIAAAVIVTPIAVAVAATSGALDWLSGDSASALIAEDVRLGPPGAEPNDETEVGLGVTGVLIDCPPTGAGPEDKETLFQEQEGRFWVTGTLSSFDGAAAVVAGPSGDVSATLGNEFNLVGDLSPGTAVEMAGTANEDGSKVASELRSACAGAGVIDCATEADPHFQLRLDGDVFDVTGRLESLTGDKISVMGPGLVVEISRDGSTAVEGGLDAGDPVRVEGTVLDARQLQALAVALQCEGILNATPAPGTQQGTAAAEVDEDEDEDDDEDKNCNRGHRGRGALRFEVDGDGEAKIKRGAVLSIEGESLSVQTPAGAVSVIVGEDTEVKGDIESAVEVRVEGEMETEGSLLAEEIKVLCPAGLGDDDEDDEDNDKDNDEDEDEEDEAGEDEDDGDGGEGGNSGEN